MSTPWWNRFAFISPFLKHNVGTTLLKPPMTGEEARSVMQWVLIQSRDMAPGSLVWWLHPEGVTAPSHVALGKKSWGLTHWRSPQGQTQSCESCNAMWNMDGPFLEIPCNCWTPTPVPKLPKLGFQLPRSPLSGTLFLLKCLEVRKPSKESGYEPKRECEGHNLQWVSYIF